MKRIITIIIFLCACLSYDVFPSYARVSHDYSPTLTSSPSPTLTSSPSSTLTSSPSPTLTSSPSPTLVSSSTTLREKVLSTNVNARIKLVDLYGDAVTNIRVVVRPYLVQHTTRNGVIRTESDQIVFDGKSNNKGEILIQQTSSTPKSTDSVTKFTYTVKLETHMWELKNTIITLGTNEVRSLVIHRTPVIFVPGIMGSYLDYSNPFDNKNCNVWPTSSKLLSFRACEGDFYKNEAKHAALLQQIDNNRIYPTDILREQTNHLDFLGNIYNIFIQHLTKTWPEYGAQKGMNMAQTPLSRCNEIKKLVNNGTIKTDQTLFYAFGYDWRKRTKDNAHELSLFIDCVQSIHNTKVNLVGHSMGGLVIKQLVLFYKDKSHIKTISTLNTPYLGAVRAIDIMANGDYDFMDNVILDKPYLKLVARTVPGAIELLPSDSYIAQSSKAPINIYGQNSTNYLPLLKEKFGSKIIDKHKLSSDVGRDDSNRLKKRTESIDYLILISSDANSTIDQVRLQKNAKNNDEWVVASRGAGDSTVNEFSLSRVNQLYDWNPKSIPGKRRVITIGYCNITHPSLLNPFEGVTHSEIVSYQPAIDDYIQFINDPWGLRTANNFTTCRNGEEVLSLGKPEIMYPIDMYKTADGRWPMLGWQAGNGVTSAPFGYRIQISKVRDFKTLLVDVCTVDNYYLSENPLTDTQHIGELYWRVNYVNKYWSEKNECRSMSVDPTTWSPVRTFVNQISTSPTSTATAIPTITPSTMSNVIGWGDNRNGMLQIPASNQNIIGIAALRNTTVYLKSNGTVHIRGWNGSGMYTVPNNLNSVEEIAAGRKIILARKSDRTLVCWPVSSCGTLNNLTDVKSISAGNGHILVLKSNGTVVAWGNNNLGQSTVPANLNNVIAVAAGNDHSLALKSDGTVVAWGNKYNTATKVPTDLTDVVSIAAGPRVSLAIKSTGEVITWGNGAISQLPEQLKNVVSISSSITHALARTSDGKVIAWGGANIYGQETVPTDLNNVVAVSAGESYSLALKSDGTVVAWGRNEYGESNFASESSENTIVDISVGLEHSLALKADGSVIAWGKNIGNQINVPRGLNNVVAISTGFASSLALKSDGTVVSWGRGAIAELPDGLNNVVKISSNRNNALALKSDGTVVVWGSLPQPPFPLTNIVAISAGYHHALALQSDGKVVTWGSLTSSSEYNNKLYKIPNGLSNVVDVGAGSNYSLALKSDGTVVVWGYNSNVATVPSGLQNVIKISAGLFHALALTSSGQIFALGRNNSEQTNIPTGMNNISHIVAGSSSRFFALLNVQKNLQPGLFSKLRPNDLTTNRGTTQTLTWGLSLGAVSFEYCIAKRVSECTNWINVGPNRSVTLSNLQRNTTYYWQVRAKNPSGMTHAIGIPWQFTTVR